MDDDIALTPHELVEGLGNVMSSELGAEENESAWEPQEPSTVEQLHCEPQPHQEQQPIGSSQPNKREIPPKAQKSHEPQPQQEH